MASRGILGDLIKDEKGGDLLNAGGRECIVQVLYLVYSVHTLTYSDIQ